MAISRISVKSERYFKFSIDVLRSEWVFQEVIYGQVGLRSVSPLRPRISSMARQRGPTITDKDYYAQNVLIISLASAGCDSCEYKAVKAYYKPIEFCPLASSMS